MQAACSPIGAGVGAGAVVGVGAVQERGLKSAATDTGLKLAISQRLLADQFQLFTKVTVTVVEGRVMLTGAVPTQKSKDSAQALAARVQGVREVMNEIQVTPGGDIFDYGHDAGITARLRAEIFNDPQIRDINYVVETVNSVVYLMGIARTEKEITRVIDQARDITGVRRVVSHVLTQDDPRRGS
jgi:osmotically-inducible protein OsmY